jgi:hypothetical protein
MNAPSQDIKDMLESSVSGLNLTFATDLFISRMPESPDVCVALFDYSGLPPEPGYDYFYPSVQVRVRGNQGGYQAAWTVAESIRDFLRDIHDETWNSTKYVHIWCQGDILSLGQDENNRPIFSINFRIQRTTT